MKKIRNQLLSSLLLMQTISLFASSTAYYPNNNIIQPSITYNPVTTNTTIAAILKIGSKDDSFIFSSKPVIAQKYKQSSLTIEDHPQNFTELTDHRPIIIPSLEIASMVPDSDLNEVDYTPICAIAMSKMNITTDPESYNNQGQIIRKDFIDNQGYNHHIIYEQGFTIETIIDENSEKTAEIQIFTDNSQVIRSYSYDEAAKKNVLKSIEFKLSDGTTILKNVYAGKMISARIINKNGRREGLTVRDDSNIIHTTIRLEDESNQRSNRVATDINDDDVEIDDIPVAHQENTTTSLPLTNITTPPSDIILYHDHGATTTISRNATGLETWTVKNEAGKVIKKTLRVDDAIETRIYDSTDKITWRIKYYDDGRSSTREYRTSDYFTIEVFARFYDINHKLEYQSMQTYDINKKLISKETLHTNKTVESLTYYNTDGSIRTETIFAYTKYDKLYSMSDYDAHQILRRVEIYNTYGKRAEVAFYDADGKLHLKKHYHSQERLKSEEFFDLDGKIFLIIEPYSNGTKNVWRYTDQGIALIKYNADESIQLIRHYDLDGILIQEAPLQTSATAATEA